MRGGKAAARMVVAAGVLGAAVFGAGSPVAQAGPCGPDWIPQQCGQPGPMPGPGLIPGPEPGLQPLPAGFPQPLQAVVQPFPFPGSWQTLNTVGMTVFVSQPPWPGANLAWQSLFSAVWV